MIKKIILIFSITVAVAHAALSQTDFKQQYFNGKNLFRDGKYNLAMETFKKVIPYDQNNLFSEYASYYYSLSAYRQGYLAVAKDMLIKLKSLYPKWDKLDDVNYLLAKIHLDGKDYFQGLKLLNAVQGKNFQPDITALKQQIIEPIQDVETLRMMAEEYPKDEVIGKRLAKVLSKDLTNADYKALLESLITKFDLNRADYIPEVPKTFYKDVYSVSVMFPFMMNTLEPSAAKKKNQLVLDLYEGMKLAVDTLSKQGVNISMRAYDTERNPEKIKKLLATDEVKNTDLIVGPLFQEENKVIQDFSAANRINTINPVSNNRENIESNPYGFLFQPSFETLGKRSADFLAGSSRKKTCMVFYGTTKRDSVLAASFILKAGELGLQVVSAQEIPKDAGGKILTLLTTATEYDEFKYPSEFTIKKDSIGSIFVASDEALIYSKVISSVETRGDGIIILGSENWLERADFEKYQRLGIVVAAPNYSSLTSRNYQRFLRKFIRVYGRTPSNFSRIGYEFMLFAGFQLKKNGVYFQDALGAEQLVRGYLTKGFNFQNARDNQVVSFVMFNEDGELVSIEKR